MLSSLPPLCCPALILACCLFLFLQYLVKWRGLEYTDVTWEEESELASEAEQVQVNSRADCCSDGLGLVWKGGGGLVSGWGGWVAEHPRLKMKMGVVAAMRTQVSISR